MRKGKIILVSMAVMLVFAGCSKGEDESVTRNNETQTTKTQETTVENKENTTRTEAKADYNSISGYWYIDGDTLLASIHIKDDGTYESFYASGNTEYTGTVKYEDNYYCLYTTEGRLHLKFQDDGNDKKTSFVTTEGVIFKYVYGEGGLGDDGPGYVDTVGDMLAGSWVSGKYSVDIANMGEGIFAAKVVKNNDNGIFTEWTYHLIHDTEKLVANKNGIKADVIWADGSSVVAYSDGSATFELKEGKLIWKDSVDDAGKGLEFIKE